MKIKEGRNTTSYTTKIFIQDSSQTTKKGLTGLVYNSSGLTCYYIRQGDSATTAVTLATATLGTYTSGGFIQVDATNMPGVYEIGIPNAVFSSGVNAHLYLQGATNMTPVTIEIEIDSINYQDGVRAGLTALPNAAAGANTGLPVVGSQVPNANASASGGLPTVGTGTGQINPSSGKVPATLASGDVTGNLPANVNQWLSSAPASLTTSGFLQVALLRWLTDNLAGTPSALDGSGYVKTDVQTGTVSSVSGSVGSVTGNVGGNVVGSVATVTNPVTVGTNNDKSGYSLTAGEHTNITTDTQNGLTAQGYSTARSVYLDVLNIQPWIVDAVTDTSPTASGFRGSNSLSSTDNHYCLNNTETLLIFTSGVNKGLGRPITGYTGATRLFAFTDAFPSAPSNGDGYMLISFKSTD